VTHSYIVGASGPRYVTVIMRLRFELRIRDLTRCFDDALVSRTDGKWKRARTWRSPPGCASSYKPFCQKVNGDFYPGPKLYKR
jgi:hypothetical protein